MNLYEAIEYFETLNDPKTLQAAYVILHEMHNERQNCIDVVLSVLERVKEDAVDNDDTPDWNDGAYYVYSQAKEQIQEELDGD